MSAGAALAIRLGRRLWSPLRSPFAPLSAGFGSLRHHILNRSTSHSASVTVHTCASGPHGGFTSTLFVLVEPSHPGNVGAAARALKTMGFSRLVLVAPRVALVQSDPEAIAMASGAEDVLASARIVPTLADALADVTWSVALTARMREYGPPQLAPREAATAARDHAFSGDIAFVFGNERTGLSNEHVERCSALAHIPANPAYSSLNLAQAVQVLAYELRMAYLVNEERAAGAGTPEGEEGARSRAPSEDIERMYVHLENALIALGFLDPANPKKLMSRLRRLFARSGLEREEVNIVRGIAKHILLKAHGRDQSSSS
ncbi:RNA methyltransferase [Paraburkholderia sp. T12-10]|nr:RNA methyltransferase [Paraburkholderia sp. T12-10]